MTNFLFVWGYGTLSRKANRDVESEDANCFSLFLFLLSF